MLLNTNLLSQIDTLIKLAEEVHSKKEYQFTASRTGRRYYKIPDHLVKQWVIRTLNLLERIFGKDAVHTVEFRKEYEKYNGTERAFLNCHAILVVVRHDLKRGVRAVQLSSLHGVPYRFLDYSWPRSSADSLGRSFYP